MKRRIQVIFNVVTLGLSLVAGCLLLFDLFANQSNERLRLASISMDNQEFILKSIERWTINRISDFAEVYINPMTTRTLLAAKATRVEADTLRKQFDQAILMPGHTGLHKDLVLETNRFIDSLKMRHRDFTLYPATRYGYKDDFGVHDMLDNQIGLDKSVSLKRAKMEIWVLECITLDYFLSQVAGITCWGDPYYPVVSFTANKYRKGSPLCYSVHLSEWFVTKSTSITVNGQLQKVKEGKALYSMPLKSGWNPIEIQVICEHKDSTVHPSSLLYRVHADN